jgi:hypothetical protein
MTPYPLVFIEFRPADELLRALVTFVSLVRDMSDGKYIGGRSICPSLKHARIQPIRSDPKLPNGQRATHKRASKLPISQ